MLVVATALAGKKLTKRLYKLVAASAKGRTLRRGIKEVVKAVRKNQKGYVRHCSGCGRRVKGAGMSCIVGRQPLVCSLPHFARWWACRAFVLCNAHESDMSSSRWLFCRFAVLPSVSWC